MLRCVQVSTPTEKLPQMSPYLTFITKEEGNTLRERLFALLAHARQFVVSGGYFCISGFHRIYRALVGAERVILDDGERSEDTPGQR